jgi:hypothetical protein
MAPQDTASTIADAAPDAQLNRRLLIQRKTFADPIVGVPA